MTAITDGLIRPLHHKPLTSLDRAKLRVMPAHALNGRFRGIADIGGFWSAMVRSRMTLRWGNRPAGVSIAGDFGCCASG